MELFGWTMLVAFAIFDASHAAEASCTRSSISSCSKAIISTKTRTLSLTSFCSSVLGCTKSTTTLSGPPVTVTSTKIIEVTYTEEFIETETTETITYSDTITTSVEVTVVTARPTFTVEQFAITTRKVNARDVDNSDYQPRNIRQAPTSICPAADETKACSCLIGKCTPVATKDVRKTIKEVTEETSYSLVSKPITYTNFDYEAHISTSTDFYTWTETSGILSTHTTTIKCTPSATSATSFFHLQATNAPRAGINGQYYWVAPVSPRLLSFSIEAQFTDSLEAATVFSLDDQERLISRHLNGTHFANIDPYNNFQLVHMMTRFEIQRHEYLYLRCSLKPPSGKYPGGFRELYCKADGYWQADIFNFCPLYVEWFKTGLVLGTEWSETTPDCDNVVFLVKPVCDWK